MSAPRGAELENWIIDALVGQAKAAEVSANGYLRLQIQMRAHCILGIHVLRGHEPARLVGAYWQ
ncbi:MAG TPA: hypothetical protein VMG11_09450 [Steroidobacteraceae bacterium]|nr:hypothetical protein [Steroidobacteraceae bacterium]